MIDTERSNQITPAVNSGPGWKFPIITFAVVLITYCCVLFFFGYQFINTPERFAEYGPLGDSIGVINALFSALAFAAVVSSL